MKALRKLYLANLTEFLSNRRALFLTIAFPVLFIVIFGVFFTNQDKADATVGIVVEDGGDPLGQEIIQAIERTPRGDGPAQEREKNPFSELKFREGTKAALVDQLRKGRLDAIITIPAGLAKNAAAMKERSLRETAAQIAQAQRAAMPPPAAPPATPADTPAADLNEAAHPPSQGTPAPQVSAPAKPMPAPTAKTSPAKRPAAGSARSPSGRQPDLSTSPAPAESPAASRAFTLSSTPAPFLPAASVSAPPIPSALVRRVEVVADDPGPPLPPAQLTLTIDPTRQLLRPVLQGLLGHILAAVDTKLSGETPFAELRTESIQARELRTIDYLLPGILALSIMQLGLLATAQPLVALRVQGVLKRLSATPLPRTTLLTAYIAFRLTIALFQTMLSVAIGRYAFNVAMVGSWWVFSGWVLLGTLVFLSMGFFMAAVSKNEESCTAIGTIMNLPMILLSGVFFPVNHLSPFWDYFIKLVPLNYLADALRTTMVDAPPLHSAATNASVLGGWVIVMTVLAVRFFSWESR